MAKREAASRSSGLARAARGATATILLAALAACGGGGASSSSGGNGGDGGTAQGLSPAADLGRRIFSDVSLSANGRQSCASCHAPNNAFAMPSDGATIPTGGVDGVTPGFRAAPSLRYLNTTPAFFFDDEGTPTGGFDRDGRADSLAIQARRPFLAPHEMANEDVTALLAKVAQAAWVGDFKALFGATVLDDPETAFDRLTFAIQRFEVEDPSFAPFSSRFDDFLAGRGALTDQEVRGLALFNSPSKGNCASCHLSARGGDGSSPLFTDFTYDNLGVPRNTAIPATADPAYFDLGLCGPDRTDGLAATRPDLCGAFKVPTLRNVATRHAFFHNGRFTTLEDTLRFYVTRDTDPARWYPTVGGVVQKFDDLPAAYRGNVNTTEAPYNRRPGDAPALTEAEIADVAAFLRTLTDADLR